MCLLLLPGVLEELPFRARGEDLLRAPYVAAVEPPRVSLRRAGDAVAVKQAQRLSRRLPGTPRLLVVLDAGQYRLARALVARHPGCELWYGPDPGASGELHDLALQRAERTFDPAGVPGTSAFRQNAELWDRLEELGIARR